MPRNAAFRFVFVVGCRKKISSLGAEAELAISKIRIEFANQTIVVAEIFTLPLGQLLDYFAGDWFMCDTLPKAVRPPQLAWRRRTLAQHREKKES